MQNFIPRRKKQSHSITSDGLDFLKNFSKNLNYNGNIQVAAKDETGFKPICFVCLRDLAEYVSKMELYPQKSYYFSATSFTKMERSYENMFACHAIVIDIDCHADLFTEWERDNLIDNFVWRFRNDCVECGDLISPNYIVFTGRGVQLWWFITPVYAPQFKKCILDVSKHFVGIPHYHLLLFGFSVPVLILSPNTCCPSSPQFTHLSLNVLTGLICRAPCVAMCNGKPCFLFYYTCQVFHLQRGP